MREPAFFFSFFGDDFLSLFESRVPVIKEFLSKFNAELAKNVASKSRYGCHYVTVVATLRVLAAGVWAWRDLV